jgi:hypothetical protein
VALERRGMAGAFWFSAVLQQKLELIEESGDEFLT